LTAINTAKFSSDRTIHEYAKEIWDIKPIDIPKPSTSAVQRIQSVSMPKNQAIQPKKQGSKNYL